MLVDVMIAVTCGWCLLFKYLSSGVAAFLNSSMMLFAFLLSVVFMVFGFG